MEIVMRIEYEVNVYHAMDYTTSIWQGRCLENELLALLASLRQMFGTTCRVQLQLV
jgi:hypothetical protein